MDELEISIVLPCYNEQDNVQALCGELRQVLDPLGKSYEVIFVDDGSKDETIKRLQEVQLSFPEVRVLQHRVNCGESAAQATGFQRSRGEVIVTMDSDGQNDPADIPRLLEGLERVDAVCGVRRRREDDWLRRISSKVANRFRNLVTGDRITDAGCTYRALRHDALREVPVFNGMHRFLPTLLRLQGYKVEEIAVNHRPRMRGVSKYGLSNRMFRGILDCLAMRWWRRRAIPGRRVEASEPAFENPVA